MTPTASRPKRVFGEYIARCYGLTLFKGQHVRCGDQGEPGVVVDADHHVHVRMEGQRHTVPWHPSDVKPLETPSPKDVA